PAPVAQMMPPDTPSAAASDCGSWFMVHLRVDGQDGGQNAVQRRPVRAAVAAGVDMAAGGAEIDTQRIETVAVHAVTQHGDIAVRLRQAGSERVPAGAGVVAAIDAQTPVDGGAKLAGILRN